MNLAFELRKSFDYFVMLEITRRGEGTCTFNTQGRQSNIFGSNIFGKVRYCFVQGLSIKSGNSGLKWGKSSGKIIFRNSCKSDAIVEEIFMILPDIFGFSSRNLMTLGGKIWVSDGLCRITDCPPWRIV